MWMPLPVSLRTLALAGAALLVTGVLSFAGVKLYQQGYAVGRADGDREVAKMYRAGVEASQRRDVQINTLREQGLEDSERIARLSGRGRVLCTPSPPADRLPGSADAGPAGGHRGGEVDLAPVLRQCLRTFCEVNGALGAPCDL